MLDHVCKTSWRGMLDPSLPTFSMLYCRIYAYTTFDNHERILLSTKINIIITNYIYIYDIYYTYQESLILHNPHL